MIIVHTHYSHQSVHNKMNEVKIKAVHLDYGLNTNIH